jgi:DNA-binding response OmpR family regulator
MLGNVDKDEISYVLLDLNMPRLNGYEVLRALSNDKDGHNLIVIIFSSSNNEKDIALCYEMGAKAYVIKPLDLNELDRTIHAIHSFWGNTNIRPNNN